MLWQQRRFGAWRLFSDRSLIQRHGSRPCKHCLRCTESDTTKCLAFSPLSGMDDLSQNRGPAQRHRLFELNRRRLSSGAPVRRSESVSRPTFQILPRPSVSATSTAHLLCLAQELHYDLASLPMHIGYGGVESAINIPSRGLILPSEPGRPRP